MFVLLLQLGIWYALMTGAESTLFAELFDADVRYTAASLAAAGAGVGIVDGGGSSVDSVGWGPATNVFVELAPAVQARLREKGWRFYTFLGETGCRLMCAWDTTPETVDRFAADLAASALER